MWFLAFRYLLSRKRQTLLTLSGVLLGTSAFIAFAGIMTGFQNFIIDQLVNNDSHIRVSAREEILTEHSLDKPFYGDLSHVFWLSPPSGRIDNARIENPTGWFQRLDQDPHVLSYVPQFKVHVLVSRGKITEAGQLIGTQIERQVRVSSIEKYMAKGQFADIGSSGNRVVMGDGLLRKVGARVGENVLISSGTGKPVPFKVVGAFHFGITGIDDSIAYSSLADVQNMAGQMSVVSDIAIRLDQVSEATRAAKDWQFLSRDKVQSWDQSNASILSVFSLQNFIRNFVTISIMVVAAFGIYNILNITVNQKRKDIGILRSIGFTGSDIVHLFLLQGITLGLVGGLSGLFAGYLLCLYLQTLQIGGMIDRMQISFAPSLYLSGFCMALAASVVSSLLPARAAGKLEPIEILRSGE